MIVKAILLTATGLLLSFALFFFAPDPRRIQLEMVVDRSDGNVEVYFSAQATALTDLFDLPPQKIAGRDGTVDFNQIRLVTADIGDALFEKVESRVANVVTQVDAMSVMVHPIGDKMRLKTALDGMIAISVCLTENPPQLPTLAQVQAYSGFVVTTNQHTGTVLVKMPNPAATSWRVSVRDYTDGTLQRNYVTSISPKGELTLPGGSNVSMFGRIVEWGKILVGSGSTNA